MDALDLSRWQFGITTLYHFIFVPLTIGLTPLVAIMQTAWYRTGDEKWLRLTKFFGKLMLINFAIGVVTGIVQEFQFGMNWSAYSEFVGDVFGAPLAIEALVAFFLESVFLGLWIFGWDKLPKKVHLAAIWATAIGVNLSAYFIIAANSFMQHPVGARFNPDTGRAELVSLWAVLTNNTTLAAFPHTVSGSFLTAGTFVTAISAWWMVRSVRAAGGTGKTPEAWASNDDVQTYRKGVRFGLWVVLISAAVLSLSGDIQAKLMFQQQPMKMAAAEALCETETGAGFSVFSIGDLNNACDVTSITVPNLASFLATGDPNATLLGVKDLQQKYVEAYGPNGVDGSGYVPLLPVTYWAFRLMIGIGLFAGLLAVVLLWLTRKGKVTGDKRVAQLALFSLATPFLGNLTGWLFTEMGRQPWVVAPNPTGDAMIRLRVEDAVSPYMDSLSVFVSLAVFTLLYGALAVVWYGLMKRYVLEGAPQLGHHPEDADGSADQADRPAPMSFVY